MQNVCSQSHVTWNLQKTNQGNVETEQELQTKAEIIGKLVLPGMLPKGCSLAASRLKLKKKLYVAHKVLIQSLSVFPLKKIIITQSHTLKSIRIDDTEKNENWKEGAIIIDYIYGLIARAVKYKVSHFENNQGTRLSIKNLTELLVKKYGSIPSTNTIKGITSLMKSVLSKNGCYEETAWMAERQNVIKLASYYFNSQPDNQKVIELATYFFHTCPENQTIGCLVDYFLKNVANTFLIESTKELFRNVSEIEKNKLALEYFKMLPENERKKRNSAIDCFNTLTDVAKLEIGLEYYKSLTENQDVKSTKNIFQLFFENQEKVNLALGYFKTHFKTSLTNPKTEFIDNYFKSLPKPHRKKFSKNNDKFAYCLLEGIFPTQFISNKLVLDSLMIPLQTLIGVYCLYRKFIPMKKIFQIGASILDRSDLPMHQKMNILNFISSLCKINLYPDEKLFPKVQAAFAELKRQCQAAKVKEISRVFDEIQYYFYFQYAPPVTKNRIEDRLYSSDTHINKVAEQGISYKNFSNFVCGISSELKLKSAKLISKLTVLSFFLEESPEISKVVEFNNKIFYHFKNIYAFYRNSAFSKDPGLHNKAFSSDSTKSDSHCSDLDLSLMTTSSPSNDLSLLSTSLNDLDASSGSSRPSDSQLHNLTSIPSNDPSIRNPISTRSNSRGRFKIEVSPTRMNSKKLSRVSGSSSSTRVSSSSSSRSIDSNPRPADSDSQSHSDSNSKQGRQTSRSSSPGGVEAHSRVLENVDALRLTKGDKICRNIIFFFISLAYKLAIEENDLFSSYAIFSVIQTDMWKQIQKIKDARVDLKNKKTKLSYEDIEIDEILKKLNEVENVLQKNYNAKVQKCEKEKIFYLPPISKMKAAITGQIQEKGPPPKASELAEVDFECIFKLSTIIVKQGKRLESIRLQAQKFKKPILKSDIIKKISQVAVPKD